MTRPEEDLRIEWLDDPATFFRRHAEVLSGIGASAFAQPEPVMRHQVADRFAKAALAQVLRADGEIVGFGLFDRLDVPGREPGLWVVEGRAITPAISGEGWERGACASSWTRPV
ncbi:hypothetical protein [Lentzea sp. E54]|uniref:hypothetical protein n=1 Tax=Lentzea xerophila TaxID=3435883 RepID=UPI003DA524FF